MSKKRGMREKLIGVILSILMILQILPSLALAAATTSHIGLTSDIHGATSNLTAWLDKLNDTTLALDDFIFGGDFDYTESKCNETAAACVTEVNTAYPGTPIFTTRGNHDVSDALEFTNKGTAPITGSTESNIGYNTGLVYNGPDYAIYIMDSSSQAFLNADVDALSDALDTIEASDTSKPVLVVSHIPIHYLSAARYSGNTAYLLSALNPHPNVVFLWGHNHSQNDPEYGVVRKAGYSIKYTSSNTMPITFTYGSMGAMLNGVNSAYGLLLTIVKDQAGATVTFEYKNLSGATVSTNSVTIGTGSSEISSVAVTGLTAPVGGAAPDTNAAVSTGASVTNVSWYYGSTLFEGSAFTTGVNYTVQVTLEPVGGKTFAASPTATINGGEADIVSASGAALTVSRTFITQEPAVLYQLATSVTSGKEYAVVLDGVAMSAAQKTDTYTSGSTTYDYTGRGYVTPEINGSNLTFATQAEADSATWIFTASGDGWTIKNGDAYLYAQAERTLVLDSSPHVFTYGESGSNGTQLSVTIGSTAYVLCFGHGSSVSSQTGDLIYPSQHNANVLKLYENTGTTQHEDPPAEEPGYERVASPESGGTYVLVAESGGTAYAMASTTGSADATLGGVPVRVSGDLVLAADVTDAMKWLLTTDGDGYDLTNGSDYLNRKSGGGLLVETQEADAGYSDWLYDQASGYLYTTRSSSSSYINLTSGDFTSSTSSSANRTLRLYKVTDLTPVGGSVALTDLEPPVSGASPDTDAATSLGLIGGISWSPAVTGAFAGNTIYTAQAKVYPLSGTAFAAGVTASLNGAAAAVTSNPDGSVTVSRTFARTAPASAVTYEPATSIAAGETYLIVSDKNGTKRALQNAVSDDHYLAGTEISISGSTITPVTDDLLWTAESGTGGFCFVNGGKYLTRGDKSGSNYYLEAGAKSGTSLADWYLDSNKFYVLDGTTKYYLYWSGGGYFRGSSSAGSSESYNLYMRHVASATLLSVGASFDQTGFTVDPATSLDSLKAHLTVSAVYSDGTIQLLPGEYTLNGTLLVGTSTITVGYGGLETTFDVTVTPNISDDLDWIAAHMSLTGSVASGITGQFPETIPAAIAAAGYKINSEITLSTPLPAGSRVSVSLNGQPYIVNKDIGDDTSFLITDLIPGSVPAVFDTAYNGQTETYLITITGNQEAIHTKLTLKSVLSKDGFLTTFPLVQETFDLDVAIDMSAALQALKDNMTITGSLTTEIRANFPVLPPEIAALGYKINTLVTLDEPLPTGTTVTAAMTGGPSVTKDMGEKSSFTFTDLFGVNAADFDMDYSGRVEKYKISLTGTVPFNTLLTLQTYLYKDETVVPLEMKEFNLSLADPEYCTVNFEAGDHGSLTGQSTFENILKDAPWSEAIPALPAYHPDEGYYFTGWTPGLPDTVSEDMTYTANFALQTYTVTWNVNGSTATSSVDYGTVPSYNSTPLKASTDQYTYTFAGWSTADGGAVLASLPKVTGNVTYYAVFTQTVRTYTVTWNVNGSTTTSSVGYGTVPSYSGMPTKASTDQYTYTFAGWSTAEGGAVLASLPKVTGSATYYAVFTQTVRTYTITWNVGGAVRTAAVSYGTVPSYSGTPTKASTDQYTYTFTGWSTADGGAVLSPLPKVTGDVTYYAVFAQTARTYTVTWNVGGTVSTTAVSYGTVPSYNGTPTKASTDQYTYTFKGWSATNGGFIFQKLPVVTGNVIYYAVFTQTARAYTITWNINGMTASSTFAYGSVPVYWGTPAKPATAQNTYTFKGWSTAPNGMVLSSLPAVTANASYYAVFTALPRNPTPSPYPSVPPSNPFWPPWRWWRMW
jgi:hypothetical protein